MTADLQRLVVESDSGMVGHAVMLYHSAISKLRIVPATLADPADMYGNLLMVLPH